MTVILPTPVGGSAAGWELMDYTSPRRRSDPAAGGVATIEFAALPSDELWLVDHAVTSCSSTTATSLRWYADVVDPARLLEGTNVGNFDVADWPNGLQLAPGTSLVMVWDGASDGAIATAALQVRVLRRR